MVSAKNLIIGFIVLFWSCTNPTGTTKKQNNHSNGPVETAKKSANQKPIETNIATVWNEFRQAVFANNLAYFQQLSLDSLYTCDTVLSTTKFIRNCYHQVFDTTLLKKMATSLEIIQIDNTMELGYFRNYALAVADFKSDTITLKQYQIVKEFTPDGEWTITFDFIKTNHGYKFFGCDSYGGTICCH